MDSEAIHEIKTTKAAQYKLLVCDMELFCEYVLAPHLRNKIPSKKGYLADVIFSILPL